MDKENNKMKNLGKLIFKLIITGIALFVSSKYQKYLPYKLSSNLLSKYILKCIPFIAYCITLL